VSSALPRPGAALGRYPERTGGARGWAERAGELVTRLGAWRPRAARDELATFVRAVGERRAEVRALGEDALDAAVHGLRGDLARGGLAGPALVSAFALVREAAARALGTEPYDVQVAAGRVIADGMLAEMGTGEGKTLAATLPACAAALAGIPVHVVTANDYLARRDADALRPLYARLGLTVGAVSEAEREPARRRAAYACDVTYATAKSVAFDYLRDGLERRQRRGLALAAAALESGRAWEERLVLRGLCFAIVDEADSVLVDEARTPLVLSGHGAPSDDGRHPRSAVRIARALSEGRDFEARPDGAFVLTAEGCERVSVLARPLGGFWSDARRREEQVRQALAALHRYVRDRDYLVRDGAIEIVDPSSGRTAPGRAWERGLHQMIEVKEGCAPTPERETVARLTYQAFFRRYLRLAGTTGTAREVARELHAVYGLRVVRIPPRRPSRRLDLGVRVLPSLETKWRCVVEAVEARVREGRPVLVGTESIAASEHLAGLLAARGWPHRVLNARQDAEEAAIVAEAGARGRITVSTQMAGRGTDIRLGPGVAELGGLHVIATHRARARRIDRQLFGRCGRQGEPGSHETILSLGDELALNRLPEKLRGALQRMLEAGVPGVQACAVLLMHRLQRAEEDADGRVRRSLVASEERLGSLLAFSGSRE